MDLYNFGLERVPDRFVITEDHIAAAILDPT